MSRGLRTLLALLLVLGAGLAVTDEAARRVAQQRIATQLSHRLGATPSVQVHGWPVLPSLLQGRLQRVDAQLPSGTAEVDGHRVPVQELRLQAMDVRGVSDPGRARAGQVQGSARVGYASLSRAVGAEVTPAGQGRARVSGQVLLRQVELVGVPAIRDGHFVVLQPSGTADGQAMDPRQAQQAADALSALAPVPSRAGMELTGITATDQGIELQLSGRDVAIQALR